MTMLEHFEQAAIAFERSAERKAQTAERLALTKETLDRCSRQLWDASRAALQQEESHA